MVVTIERQLNMIQCTLVGDGMVGKTCLSLAFARSSAPAMGEYVATVFENYAGKSNVNGDDYTVSIFDSAGQVSRCLSITSIICIMSIYNYKFHL